MSTFFGTKLFDTALFDAPSSGIIVNDEIQFNGYGLQNTDLSAGGIITRQVIYSAPQRDLGEAAYPRAPGEYIQTDYFRKTIIQLLGTVKGTSRIDLEQRMNVLKQNLAVGNGLLQLTFAGIPIFWNAYADISAIFDSRDHYNITWCKYQVSFTCINPFARSKLRGSVTPPTPCTVSPTTYDITNNGTAPSKGIWTFQFTTAGTCSEIALTNTTTSEGMSVSAAFADGDILIINGETATVTINGVPADFTGIFPSVAAGLNSFTLEPNGSGFSIQVLEESYDMYL